MKKMCRAIDNKQDGGLTVQMPQAHGDDPGVSVDRCATAVKLGGVKEWDSSENDWSMLRTGSLQTKVYFRALYS